MEEKIAILFEFPRKTVTFECCLNFMSALFDIF